jgi:hypothetical protein
LLDHEVLDRKRKREASEEGAAVSRNKVGVGTVPLSWTSGTRHSAA